MVEPQHPPAFTGLVVHRDPDAGYSLLLPDGWKRTDLPDDGGTPEAGLLLIAQLLELLGVFVGEHLVLRLLSDVWPDFSFVDAGVQQEAEK